MEEVLPVANRLDPEKGGIPRELLRKMAELGYFGIVIDEKYRGMGLGRSPCWRIDDANMIRGFP
jgi:butyryl-CoA dehydrogenase/acyl-CoA dehydrogenase